MKNKAGLSLIIAAICALSIGILAIIAGFITVALDGESTISTILFVVGVAGCIGGFVLIIVRASKYGFEPISIPEEKVIKTVDVKPIKETQEEKLFKEYEKLYKEGLITKEDLENKKKELNIK